MEGSRREDVYVLIEELDATVKETKVLLDQNGEWRSRYEGYGNRIAQNLDLIKSVRKSFRQWDPLHIYLNTTSALEAKRTVRFGLRYHGQTVANLTGINTGKHKLSTKGYEKNSLRDFDCAIKLDGVDWAGNEAAEFRRFFKDRKDRRNATGNKGNEEHRLESMWLSELKKSKDKTLPYSKPVEIGKIRFPMPTPLSASNHRTIKYSGNRGGGIDILARVGTGGRNTYLCIFELKDENVSKEPPSQAVRQAVVYTTFIRELIRSESGNIWWQLFGFGREIPKQLILYATCLMPSSSYNDYSFKDIELHIEEDIVKLHYVYFTEKNNRITDVDTSLKWSL